MPMCVSWGRTVVRELVLMVTRHSSSNVWGTSSKDQAAEQVVGRRSAVDDEASHKEFDRQALDGQMPVGITSLPHAGREVPCRGNPCSGPSPPTPSGRRR